MRKKQEAHIKGGLIKWARETARLSLQEAARQLKVTTQQLEQWESGDSKPTVRQLRDASRVFRRPLAAFFLPEPPKDFRVPHDFRRLPNGETASISPGLAAEIRLAQFRRDIALDLAEEISELPKSFIGSVALTSNVDEIARQMRTILDVTIAEQRAWKDSYTALKRWTEAMESAGVLVFQFSRVKTEEIRGFSFAQMQFPCIAVNGGDAPTARIFTLLHEFAHLLLGAEGCCDLDEDHAERSKDTRVEVFCNRIAGATLVPTQELKNERLVREATSTTEWSEDELKNLSSAFGVSREVILRRLLTLGKTSEPFYRAMRSRWQQRPRRQGGGFMQVHQQVIRNLGKSFLNIVLQAYYREAITSADLAEYLGARLKHLPNIEESMVTTS